VETNKQLTIDEITSEKRHEIEKMAAQMPDWAWLSSEVKSKMGASYLRVAYDIQQAQKKALESRNKAIDVDDDQLQVGINQHVEVALSNDSQEFLSKLIVQERTQLNNQLNKGQKNTLIATACALFLSVLYPPFQITVQGMTVTQGFHWLWQKGDYQYTGVVDVAFLLCEILVICLVGGISYRVVLNNENK
jgi:hypothetical protein